MMDEQQSVPQLLTAEPLEAGSFSAFGQVIAAQGESSVINQGTSQKFANLATVELDPGARATMHLYRPEVTVMPCSLRVLERHPLASQAFIPLGPVPFLVVVCAPGSGEKARTTDSSGLAANQLRAFISSGQQGIQFRTGVWHHPLIALGSGEFLIVDRYCETEADSRRNLEMVEIEDWRVTVQLQVNLDQHQSAIDQQAEH